MTMALLSRLLSREAQWNYSECVRRFAFVPRTVFDVTVGIEQLCNYGCDSSPFLR